MSVGHYENFPVASLLLPAKYRRAVIAIYRFARAADDVADEGTAPPPDRHAALARFARALDAIERGERPEAPLLDAIERGERPEAPLLGELAQVVAIHNLPLAPFRDLLSAFAQDVDVGRYPTFDDVLDYCRRSANPVGRLLLALYGVDGAAAAIESDAICTALQLANFWQDIAVDWRKDRVYLPLEDLDRFGVPLSHVAGGVSDAAWARLLAFETARTRALFDAGRPLTRRLPWRIGIELSAVIAGGMRILDRIDAVRGDVFRRRPVLRKRDVPLLAWRTLAPARARSA